MDEAIDSTVLEAINGLQDPHPQVCWLSALRISNHILRGKSLPSNLQSKAIANLKKLLSHPMQDETRLFACISLALLGDADAKIDLERYQEHECQMFRENASFALATLHD